MSSNTVIDSSTTIPSRSDEKLAEKPPVPRATTLPITTYSAATPIVNRSLSRHSSFSDSIRKFSQPPTSLVCSGCTSVLPIPPTAWSWTCKFGHINTATHPHCEAILQSKLPSKEEIKENKNEPIPMRLTQCGDLRPKVLTPPQLQCNYCHTITSVPTNEFQAYLNNSISSINHEILKLTTIPDEFHCSNCNSLIKMNTQNWQCQACFLLNKADNKSCAHCHQNITSQKVLCTICNCYSSIPAFGATDIMKSGAKSVFNSMRKLSLKARSKPFANCTNCGCVNELTSSQANSPANSRSNTPRSSRSIDSKTDTVGPLNTDLSKGDIVNPNVTTVDDHKRMSEADLSQFTQYITCKNCKQAFTIDTTHSLDKTSKSSPRRNSAISVPLAVLPVMNPETGLPVQVPVGENSVRASLSQRNSISSIKDSNKTASPTSASTTSSLVNSKLNPTTLR